MKQRRRAVRGWDVSKSVERWLMANEAMYRRISLRGGWWGGLVRARHARALRALAYDTYVFVCVVSSVVVVGLLVRSVRHLVWWKRIRGERGEVYEFGESQSKGRVQGWR